MPAVEREKRVKIPSAQINTTENVVFQEPAPEVPKRHLSEAIKAKISMVKTGKTLSDEARRNIAIGHLGLKESKKTRRKISRSMKKRWADPVIGERLRNKTLTDEHKNKIRIGVIRAYVQKREAAKALEEKPRDLKEPPIPHPNTLGFIKTLQETGLWLDISEADRRIITLYYSTPGIRLTDLRKLVNPATSRKVKSTIFEALNTAWEVSSTETQIKYPKNETIKLKHHSYSNEHKQNMSKRLKGKHHKHGEKIGNANRGRSQNMNTRTAIGEKQRRLWQDSAYGEKMQKAFQDRNIEARLWREAQDQGLIQKIISHNLLTPEELETLRDHFETFKKTRRKGKGIEKLLERFSIAVARVA